jgi:hypothetical protein
MMKFITRKLAVVAIILAGIALAGGLPKIRAAREAARRAAVKNVFRGSPIKDLALVRSVLDELPVISLEDRLAYEDRRPNSDHAQPVPLSPKSELLLLQSEKAWGLSSRHAMLRHLHNEKYIEFVEANGFGVGRMEVMKPDRSSLILPELALIPFPRTPRTVEPQTAIHNPTTATSDSESILDLELAHLHQHGASDFTDPNRLGFVVEPRRASGFQPHSISRVPNSQASDHLAEWQVSRLQLVGLVKFKEPRVYESQNFPRMDLLSDHSTRPLDQFERHALKQLRGGEEVVTEHELNRVRIVGAVRAAAQCRECHSVRRGELLGAFSYRLDRKQPIPLPKVEAKPLSMLMR